MAKKIFFDPHTAQYNLYGGVRQKPDDIEYDQKDDVLKAIDDEIAVHSTGDSQFEQGVLQGLKWAREAVERL